MRKKLKIIIPVLLAVAVVALTAWYLARYSIPVLQPRGEVGLRERKLLIVGCLLAVIVVVPTFALTIYIAIKYREENHTAKTKYKPNFDRSRLFESIWWGIPIIIIGILCVVAWQSAHSLDPYKQLASTKKPLTVQVVALDWKWLFIYPEQNIASVNLAEIPVGTPVQFEVTSDTIMNSFWVPQLGGQIYAMPGMITQLHLVADKAGSYFGSPANIAGKGFSRMNFTVRAGSQADFDTWVKQARQADKTLDSDTYAQLAKPSDSVPVTYYAGVPDNFVDNLAMKYMMPEESKSGDNAPSENPSASPEKSMDMKDMNMQGMAM
jgi:cytochrome o ubiquinol oxidase subunit 2